MPARHGAPDRLAAELRFLIDRCRPEPGVQAERLDWALVARGIKRHGLTRLIPAMIATPGLVPPDAVAALRALHTERAGAALTRLRDVIAIAEQLDRAGVRFLFVKGLALSLQLYGKPGMRDSKDIDVLVEPGALARVDAVLGALGYARPAADRARDPLPGHDAKEIGYFDTARGVMVEVHTRLTENGDLYPTDFEELWATRETLDVAGRALPAMPRERLATYLAVHGAHHNWARLMWLLDLAPLTGSPAATEAALADARRHGLEPVLLHALWLLHHWFGHEVPAELLDRAQANRTVRLLNRMTALHHAGAHWHEAAPRHSWQRFYQYSVLGRITDYGMKSGLAYWRRQMSLDLVSPADRSLVALPPRYDWAYAVIRPFGWLIRRLKA